MGELTIGGDGGALSAEQAGEGTPVVLLHGLTATRRYVLMGSRALERSGHRVVAYDARGHGRSAPASAPTAYGYPELAGDLRGVLDSAGVERAVLVGASMGAHTVVRFALDHPGRAPDLDPPPLRPRRRFEDGDLVAGGPQRGELAVGTQHGTEAGDGYE